MTFIQLVAKAIGKIWSFVTVMIYIAIIIAFVFFLATVIFPDNVQNAIDLIASYVT
jgi:hypothetical protein